MQPVTQKETDEGSTTTSVVIIIVGMIVSSIITILLVKLSSVCRKNQGIGVDGDKADT